KYTWIGVAALLIPALAALGSLSWINSIALGVPLALFSFHSDRCGIRMPIHATRQVSIGEARFARRLLAPGADTFDGCAGLECHVDSDCQPLCPRDEFHSAIPWPGQTVRAESVDCLRDRRAGLPDVHCVPLCGDGTRIGESGGTTCCRNQHAGP